MGGQDELAKLIEDTDRSQNEGGLGELRDGMEIMPYEQIHPAIGSPKQHLATREPATVVALSKENAPGLRDHAWDVMGIDVAVGAGATVVIAQFVVNQGQMCMLEYFGWSCPPLGFANVRFALTKSVVVIPNIPVGVPNVYLPSANTVNPGDLKKCHESLTGPGTFEISATNGGGAAINVSARITGWWWAIGADEKELGDRKYARY